MGPLSPLETESSEVEESLPGTGSPVLNIQALGLHPSTKGPRAPAMDGAVWPHKVTVLPWMGHYGPTRSRFYHGEGSGKDLVLSVTGVSEAYRPLCP